MDGVGVRLLRKLVFIFWFSKGRETTFGKKFITKWRLIELLPKTEVT